MKRSSVKLEQEIGSGAFGTVYSATVHDITSDLKGRTKVAVKLCGHGMSEDKISPEDTKDFLAEATIMKKFSDPWDDNVGHTMTCVGSLTREILTFVVSLGNSTPWSLHPKDSPLYYH